MAKATEHLLSNQESPSSNPGTSKKKKKKEYPVICYNIDENPGGMILTKKSQTQKEKCCVIYFHKVFEIIEVLETQSRMLTSRDW